VAGPPKIKMKKLIAFPILTLIVSLAWNHPMSLAAPSSESKLEQLQKEYEELRSVRDDTLMAPLFTSPVAQDRLMIQGVSLLHEIHQVGTMGELFYQTVGEESYRLKYDNLNDPAAFFWLFKGEMDFRDQWFRLTYSGLSVPKRLSVQFDGDEGRNDSQYFIYLEDSLRPQMVYFKLPHKKPFGQIQMIGLGINPDDVRDPYADFLILGLEMIPQGDDPLSKLSESNFARFDFYGEPFEAENQVAVNTSQVF